MRKKILVIATAVGLLAAGVVLAVILVRQQQRPEGELDTELEGVSVIRPEPPPLTSQPTTTGTTPKERSYRFLQDDRRCWRSFGGDPQRSLARPDLKLGKPTRHFWVKGLGSYIEYPPSYCDGVLYVNTYRGVTYAIDSHNGRILWKRGGGGFKPSTPAIAGPRLIVSSIDGTVTAFARETGRVLWQFRVDAKVESSPVVVDDVAYFGATDSRLFALDVETGQVRWAYDTGGRINSSPSVYGQRICITTYAGSIFCLRRRDGHKLWHRYFKRDPLRYESFYASPSTDGTRLFTVSRAGKVLAVSASTGRLLWTHSLHTLGYSTPAVAQGRVFVGDFNGTLHAYRTSTGTELWRRHVGGRILGPAFVVGGLVFFSTLEEQTYAARVTDGKVVWRLGMGKYSPGIATDRHYFFSLNGILIAYHATNAAQYSKQKSKPASGEARVPSPPDG